MPMIALINRNPVNSEYCNSTVGNKNCYLVYGGDFNENVSFTTFSFYTKDSQDLYWVNKSELCYELIDSENCFNVLFGRYCRNCNDSNFLFNCANCSNCFGCTNLRGQSYHIFNKPYSKENYQLELQKLVGVMRSFSGLTELKARFEAEKARSIKRFATIVNSQNTIGDNIYNSKNVSGFDIYDGAENCKSIVFAVQGVKDSESVDHVGVHSELCFDSCSVFPGYKVFFSTVIWEGREIQYSYNCQDCQSLFGCIGLRRKSYCILNKQYAKEEYEVLVPKIIEHMNTMPYTDKKGIVYRYGEFFPTELSPFAYNETIAQEYFPLTKDGAFAQGYLWKDPDIRDYKPTKKAQDLPNNISDVDDSILGEVISCTHEGKCTEQCATAFKIVREELEFYRRLGLSLPHLCPNCRHYERLKQRNPLKLWHRKCQCDGRASENGVYRNTAVHQHGTGHCSNEFETSYSPDRKEIVYCEQCYQAEVV